jgi:hypothetical protein
MGKGFTLADGENFQCCQRVHIEGSESAQAEFLNLKSSFYNLKSATKNLLFPSQVDDLHSIICFRMLG